MRASLTVSLLLWSRSLTQDVSAFTNIIARRTTQQPSVASTLYSTRRDILVSLSLFGVALIPPTEPSWADVSDGNTLPQAARQFARSIQLRADVENVYKRLSTAAEGDIDEKEWENIALFLRRTYQTADNEMKAVAGGVYNPVNQKQALVAIEKIKKNAQGADIYARRRDPKGLAGALAIVQDGTGEFFDALSDVPDEL